MRDTANFHPEWGYLAPAPSFIRTARVVLVGTAVGAIAGAGVVFLLVSHPSSQPPVALHTLPQPAEQLTSTLPPLAQAKVSSSTSQSPRQKESELSLSTYTGEAATNPKAGAAPPPEKTAVAPPVEGAEVLSASPEQVKRRAMKKPNVTSRYASRGGYYGDSVRGGYYGDRGWRYRNVW